MRPIGAIKAQQPGPLEIQAHGAVLIERKIPRFFCRRSSAPVRHVNTATEPYQEYSAALGYDMPGQFLCCHLPRRIPQGIKCRPRQITA